MKRRPVQMVLAVLPLAALLSGSGAMAQVGQDAPTLLQRWGQPKSGQVGTNGYGTLHFAAEDLGVEIEFVAGRAQRVSYRSASLDTEAVNRLLGQNANGANWAPWVTPGLGQSENQPRKWMRSDDGAMAELAGDGLTVVGSEWYRHLASPPPPGSTNVAPAEVEALPAETAPPPPEKEKFVGLWQSEGPNSATIVLRARSEGDGLWIVMGTHYREEKEVGWTRQATEGETAYVIHDRSGSAHDGGTVAIGTFRVASDDELRFHASAEVTGSPAHFRGWGIRAEMAFRRIASMPRWKPAAPGDLPSKGDSREKAIRVLGKPTGTMQSGEREVLVYPWGNVWVVEGVVTGVE